MSTTNDEIMNELRAQKLETLAFDLECQARHAETLLMIRLLGATIPGGNLFGMEMPSKMPLTAEDDAEFRKGIAELRQTAAEKREQANRWTRIR